MGKNIVVFDNSITHDLYNVFSKELDEGTDVIEKENLTVCKEYRIKNESKKTDYIFIYEGLYPRFSGFIDIAIIAPGYESSEWNEIRPHVDKCRVERVRTVMVLRDHVGRKISDRLATASIGIEPSVFLKTEFDLKDYENYVLLTHNKAANINKNGELYEVLKVLIAEVYKITSAKELKQLLK